MEPNLAQAHLEGHCPVCDTAGHLRADLKARRDGGDLDWFYYCVKCGATLPALVGATGIEQRFWEYPVGPPEEYFDSTAGAGREFPPEPIPSVRDLLAARDRLQRDRKVMRWVRRERGINRDTLLAHHIGYGQRRGFAALTIPVLDEHDAVINVRYRYWPRLPVDRHGKEIKIVGLRGRGTQLWPAVPGGDGPLLLCEGELDALLGRQHGLPTITSTGGTSWKEDWGELVAGRRIAVMYDAGSADKAQRTLDKLADHADAWAVALPLEAGEDLTDWYMKYGYSTAALLRLIRESRLR